MELTLCPYCMEPLDGAGGPCLHCGENPTSYQPLPHHLPPGTILQGRYVLGRTLGEGGFGITYIGYDLTLGLKVAVKEYFPTGDATRTAQTSAEVLSLHGTEGLERGIDRFLSEARVLARLQKNQAVVNVRDFFEANGTAYIVMEFVEGQTLLELAQQRGGRLPVAELLTLVEPVFSALSDLHNAGLVHRDVSPDNVMVTPEGRTRVIDFGCARESADGMKTMTVALKYDYAPIEQYNQKGQGSWTDVYALAATIYRCMCGTPVPPAMERVASDSLVRPTELGVSLSPTQEEGLLRALAVLPNDRTHDVNELHEALYGPSPASSAADSAAQETEAVAPVVVAAAGEAEHGPQAAEPYIPATPVIDTPSQATAEDELNLEDKPSEDAAPKKGLGARLKKSQIKTKQPRAQKNKRKTADAKPKSNRKRLVRFVLIGTPLFIAVALIFSILGIRLPSASDGMGTGDMLLLEEALEEERKDVYVTEVAAGTAHSVGLRSDGTVVAVGDNTYGQCDVDEWHDVKTISACGDFTVGLLEDGTVVAVGDNTYGQCDVGKWKNVEAISAGRTHTVGLRKDGTLLATGDQSFGCCNVGSWADVAQVSAGAYHTAAILDNGLVDETILYMGKEDWSHINTKLLEKGEQPTVASSSSASEDQLINANDTPLVASSWLDIIFTLIRGSGLGLTDIAIDFSSSTNMEQLSTGWFHAVSLQEDGTVSAVGYNRHGECNVKKWSNIESVSTGRHTTIGLQEDGTLIATGENKDGQLDVGGWYRVTAVSVGSRHTLVLLDNGAVIATGNNDQGQCDVRDW